MLRYTFIPQHFFSFCLETGWASSYSSRYSFLSSWDHRHAPSFMDSRCTCTLSLKATKYGKVYDWQALVTCEPHARSLQLVRVDGLSSLQYRENSFKAEPRSIFSYQWGSLEVTWLGAGNLPSSKVGGPGACRAWSPRWGCDLLGCTEGAREHLPGSQICHLPTGTETGKFSFSGLRIRNKGD